MFSCQRLVGWDLLLYGEATRLGNTILDNFKYQCVHLVSYVRVPLQEGIDILSTLAESLNMMLTYTYRLANLPSHHLCMETLQHARCLPV